MVILDTFGTATPAKKVARAPPEGGMSGDKENFSVWIVSL